MRWPVVTPVVGGFVVTAGFVPRLGFLHWVAQALAVFSGKDAGPPVGAQPAGIVMRTRPAELPDRLDNY